MKICENIAYSFCNFYFIDSNDDSIFLFVKKNCIFKITYIKSFLIVILSLIIFIYHDIFYLIYDYYLDY